MNRHKVESIILSHDDKLCIGSIVHRQLREKKKTSVATYFLAEKSPTIMLAKSERMSLKVETQSISASPTTHPTPLPIPTNDPASGAGPEFKVYIH